MTVEEKRRINSNIRRTYRHEGIHDLFLAINFKMKLRRVIPLIPSCAVSSLAYEIMTVHATTNMIGTFQPFYDKEEEDDNDDGIEKKSNS